MIEKLPTGEMPGEFIPVDDIKTALYSRRHIVKKINELVDAVNNNIEVVQGIILTLKLMNDGSMKNAKALVEFMEKIDEKD
jgi:hypothetical protein